MYMLEYPKEFTKNLLELINDLTNYRVQDQCTQKNQLYFYTFTTIKMKFKKIISFTIVYIKV